MSSGTVEIMPGVPTDEATSAEGADRLGKLGHTYYYKGSLYKLVKNVSTTTALTQYAGVAWSDPAIGTATVTATTEAGTGTTGYFAGFAQSAIAAEGFGYIGTGGVIEAFSAGTAAAGALLYIDGTDGRLDTATVGTHDIIGTAIDTGTADAAFTIYMRPL